MMSQKEKYYTIVKSHTRSYDNPIKLNRGERVEIVKDDPAWPGWLWCKASTGLSGWVPEDILEKVGTGAKVREDYDATELTVKVGDQLKFIKEKNGWFWCEARIGEQGWVPKSSFEPEKTLSNLIASMNPTLHPETYVFVNLSELDRQDLTAQPVMEFREEEGVTIVLEKEKAEEAGLGGQ